MPAPDLLLCSREDVLDFAFGGDAAEAQRLTRAALWDPAKLDKPIKAASADYERAAGNKFALEYSTDPTTYPFAVRQTVARRAGYYVWEMYSRGMTCPENLTKAYESTTAELNDLRDGKAGTGTTKTPQRRVASFVAVDTTSGGAFSRMSIEGWNRLP